MSFLSILANLNTLIGLFHTLENLINSVVAKKAPPSAADLLPLLSEVEAIFKAGVIKINGVDDQAVADALQMVRDQLAKVPVLDR